ncbi:MAG: glycosyltransferase [bacterium]
MRVLMYGWEFPPYISGGLGVACYNIAKYLDPLVSKLYFVLPRSSVNQDLFSKTSLLGADRSKVSIDRFSSVTETYREDHFEKLRILPVESSVTPYDKQYSELSEQVDSMVELMSKQLKLFSDAEEVAPLNVDFGDSMFMQVMMYAAQAACFATMYEHDMIHAHDWLTIPAAFEAKKYSGKPVVVHIHATEYDRSGSSMNQLIYQIERYGVHSADKVVAVSHYTKNILIQRYGLSADKIEVVHNGVSRKMSSQTSVFKKRISEKIILYLGRLTFQKGPDYFIKAARRVLDYRRDVRFVIAGSGDMMPWLMEQVTYWGLGDYFYFTGFLNDALVERLFCTSDVYVLPSVSEPFGIAPLEALYYGVPVVLSKTSGVSEVLNHVLKVDFWDVDDMANKMLALVDYQPLRQHLMCGVSDELPKINWELATQKIFDLYTKLVR